MITTNELINNLKKTNNVFEFFREYEKEFLNQTTYDVLNELLMRSGMSMSEIKEKSFVGEYVYKVFSGVRKPSRNILIAIGLALGITLEEMQLLLRVSEQALLDARSKRDAIIIFSVNYKKSVEKTEELLLEAGVEPLN